MRAILLLCAASWFATGSEAGAQDEDYKAEIEEIQKQQKELQDLAKRQETRIQELEAILEGEDGGTEEDYVKWNELTALGGRFSIYGFARIDALYDDSRANNTQTIGWILSEDSAAPPGVGAGGRNRNDFTLHPRLTRFGLDFDAGQLDSLGKPRAKAKIEIDFYNSGLNGQSESRSAVRMRKAYLTLDWEHFQLLAGQNSELISPLYPVVNNDLVMWGAGNTGDRRAQVTVKHCLDLKNEKTFTTQVGIGLTGAIDGSDLDVQGTFGSGFRDGETSGLPTFQARVAYGQPLFEQRFELGAWVHTAKEEPDTEFPIDDPTDPSDDNLSRTDEFDSNAFGFDLVLPLFHENLWVKAEYWMGENVDDIRGGIFQGINTTTGKEIDSRGGFVELGYSPLDWSTFYAGWSADNPDNRDLNTGGRSANRIWYLAGRFNFGAVRMGIEYLNWTTEYKGFGNGTDNRLGAHIAYYF